ncbi:MAG: universal stress protein [Anaerolineae bacterium]
MVREMNTMQEIPSMEATLAGAFQTDFQAGAQELPHAFLEWQMGARRAAYARIAKGERPNRFSAHLPVMITFQEDGRFPVRVAAKGAGLTPRDDVLEPYIARLEETLARCEGRPWAETLPERAAAVRFLLDHPDDIDPHRLGFLEIFQGGTYANLQRDPRVVLHYTGDGPKYPSFQINGYAEILGPDDLRYRYIALARRIFEAAPFHLPQPGYAAGYLVWVQEAFDKTPHSLKHPPIAGHRPPPPPLRIADASTELSTGFGLRIGRFQESNPKSEIRNPKLEAVTFREILVPVDNSTYSTWAMDIALQIAGSFHSAVVGNHVYAARLHDQRFRDMEPGLPEAYQEPAVLAHQRNLHDTLIGKGLKLISDSYLEALHQRCQEADLSFSAKTPEGKNYAELVQDIEASRYDLVVMGARGQGSRELRIADWGRESEIRNPKSEMELGSVCERVVRRVTRDVLVVKNGHRLEGCFVVGIDGSDRGFAALRVTLALAEACGARVQAVAVYDPILHKVLFHELEDALTEEARQVFNTEAQQKLHDELIDSGIAKIYGDHLETARHIAAEMGAEIETHLLAGKAYAAVLRHLEQVQPTLLALGRTGVHADEGLDIGSNAENLLRLAPCHVLLVGRTFTPTWAETRQVIEESLAWTPEALERLGRVPDFARGMARKAIEDYAREKGLKVVNEQVVVEARKRFGM